ncbi:MAG: stage 0 sporulation protein, partial [Clostridia bacterium]|nr:stage 0 sporulation protein [Clostridia bacterium]
YGNKKVSETGIISPLKSVLRKATAEDDRHKAENNAKEKEAMTVCEEMIAQHKLEMKLVEEEYTFDNSKMLLYFTSESRVDFRDLVKDLASVFRTRIELRQIGIRDEAKLIGGLGVCGRPVCCHSFLEDFGQVSIKMAKEQNLSLNTAKISDTCGRLMCCLRYEHDTYEEEINKTPRVDSLVRTDEGDGVVVETIPLQGLVKVQLSANPDAAPKTFSRDDVKFIGYVKKDGKQQGKQSE